jgi:hypothetical protein
MEREQKTDDGGRTIEDGRWKMEEGRKGRRRGLGYQRIS